MDGTNRPVLYSPVISQVEWKHSKELIGQLEQPELSQSLCSDAGFPKPRLLVVPNRLRGKSMNICECVCCRLSERKREREQQRSDHEYAQSRGKR